MLISKNKSSSRADVAAIRVNRGLGTPVLNQVVFWLREAQRCWLAFAAGAPPAPRLMTRDSAT